MKKWIGIISSCMLALMLCFVTPISCYAQEEDTLAPVATSKVLITDFTYENSQAVAGENVSGVVTIKNTDKENAVKNITVSMNTEVTGFQLKSGTNTRFIDKLKANGEAQCTFEFTVGKDVAPGQYQFATTLEYETEGGGSATSAANCLINVVQPVNIEMEVVNDCSEAEDGDIVMITVNIMNLGRSSIYNARCSVNGEEIHSVSTSFVGEVAGDSSSNCQIQLLMDKADVSEKDAFSNGEVLLQYEDAGGNQYEAKSTVGMKISALENAQVEAQETKPIQQWWFTLGGISLACVVLVSVFIGIKKWRGNHEREAKA